MKSALILILAVACAMAAPSTSGTRQSSRQAVANTATNTASNVEENPVAPVVEDRSSTFGFETPSVRFQNQNLNPFIRNRFSFIDSDDDVKFITSDLSGRQVAFQTQQTAVPVGSRTTPSLSNVAPVSLNDQRNMEFVAFDNSGEIIDDIDDLDDATLFSSFNSVPFVSRQNAVRLVGPSSIFNPVVRTPVRQLKKQPKFVQVDQNSFRAPSTCTCAPQRETVTRFQPAVTPARQFFQIMDFPQQNQFFQPTGFRSMFNPTQFGRGVQFILDD